MVLYRLTDYIIKTAGILMHCKTERRIFHAKEWNRNYYNSFKDYIENLTKVQKDKQNIKMTEKLNENNCDKFYKKTKN